LPGLTPDRRLYCVYIMASRSRVLYIGSTSDLVRRAYQHRTAPPPKFTGRSHISRLVWYDCSINARAAVELERRIKSWRRAKKIELIESLNPGWIDLARDWLPGMSTQDPSLRSG
jgi:putative endonuclease